MEKRSGCQEALRTLSRDLPVCSSMPHPPAHRALASPTYVPDWWLHRTRKALVGRQEMDRGHRRMTTQHDGHIQTQLCLVGLSHGPNPQGLSPRLNSAFP